MFDSIPKLCGQGIQFDVWLNTQIVWDQKLELVWQARVRTNLSWLEQQLPLEPSEFVLVWYTIHIFKPAAFFLCNRRFLLTFNVLVSQYYGGWYADPGCSHKASHLWLGSPLYVRPSKKATHCNLQNTQHMKTSFAWITTKNTLTLVPQHLLPLSYCSSTLLEPWSPTVKNCPMCSLAYTVWTACLCISVEHLLHRRPLDWPGVDTNSIVTPNQVEETNPISSKKHNTGEHWGRHHLRVSNYTKHNSNARGLLAPCRLEEHYYRHQFFWLSPERCREAARNHGRSMYMHGNLRDHSKSHDKT
jgi:hypothetical protein